MHLPKFVRCSAQSGFEQFDFVEGKETLYLLRKGIPKNTLLFAGVVNGKNIWRANYAEKKELLSEIELYAGAGNVISST